MSGVWQDLRYAARSLRLAPGFFLVAVGTLTAGMAASIAIFSVLSAVLLRPLSYPGSERLVHLEGGPSARYGLTMPDLQELSERSRTLEAVVAYQSWGYLGRNEDGVRVSRRAASVSSNYFDVLGARPALGRFFTPDEDVPGHAPVIVIGYDVWQREYGGAGNVIGRTIVTDSSSYSIIGVAPAGFADPLARTLRWGQPQAWRVHPPEFDRGAVDRSWIGFWGFGRLRPGVAVAAAESEVNALLADDYPYQPAGQPVLTVSTFHNSLVRSIRPTLVALFVSVLAVLLIGCANVANLLLSRATVRTREIALRASLGAPRARLARQLFVEAGLLSVTAAFIGILFGYLGMRGLAVMLSEQLPEGTIVSLDWRVVGFAAIASVMTALLFGMAPAVQFTRASTMLTLRESGRGHIGGRRSALLRHALAVAETALAVVLLASAGLLFRTFLNLQRIDTGFEAASVLTASMNLFTEDFPTQAQQTIALDRAQATLRSKPGVQNVAAISDLPMSGAINSTGILSPAQGESVSTLVRTIAGDYFGTLQIPLRAGRAFDSGDSENATQVAIINRTAAARHFGSVSPLGRTLEVRGVRRTIVGVVDDVTEFSVTGEPRPVLYTPYAQETQPWMRSPMQLLVRGTAPTSLTGAVRDAAGAIGTSVGEPRVLQELVARDISAPRFRARLFTLFAALALVLAAVGIGSVIAYGVAERLPEMGVRMALGANPALIVRLVVSQSLRLAMLGVVIGLAGTLALRKIVTSFLFGVPGSDPLTLLLAAAVLVTSALVAAATPALRAARVDPARTLRGD